MLCPSSSIVWFSISVDTFEIVVDEDGKVEFTIPHHYQSNVKAAGEVNNPARARRLAQEAVKATAKAKAAMENLKQLSEAADSVKAAESQQKGVNNASAAAAKASKRASSSKPGKSKKYVFWTEVFAPY